ncbi:hypothetical protein [Microcoleus sp. herbarium12]|uniref:hypothetical protein n=1 Tax=Microcoleus sp. herbarium12 TaxID=3055437 RepID=UPI002FCF25C5
MLWHQFWIHRTGTDDTGLATSIPNSTSFDFIIFEIKELGMTDDTQKWIQAHDGKNGDYKILDQSSNSGDSRRCK